VTNTGQSGLKIEPKVITVQRAWAKRLKISAHRFFIGIAAKHRALVPAEQMENAKHLLTADFADSADRTAAFTLRLRRFAPELEGTPENACSAQPFVREAA
jgi:hypothetical protein